MSVAAPGSLYQLVNDMLRRGLIRVAHPEVNDILSRRPGPLLELAYNVKNIGGKALYALKLIVHGANHIKKAGSKGNAAVNRVANTTESTPCCQRSTELYGPIWVYCRFS